MSEWKEYNLGEIAEIISERVSISNATEDNYISTENMINDFGGVVKAKKLPVVSSINSFFQDDILFSNIRTYFKKVWLAKFNGTVSPDVLVFRAIEKKCISEYLYYLLCNPDFTEYSVLTSKGAKMPRGDKEALLNYIIQLPPLPEQKSIASVLSNLDDKIDLLHRQNATLEKMAETLFRQWFVEEEKEEWEEVELGDLIDVVIDNRGKTPPTVTYQTDYPLIEVNALNSESCLVDYTVIRKYVSKDTFETWFRKHLKINDIIISTVGTIGVFSIHLINKGGIAQNLIGLRSNTISAYYLYNFFKHNKELLISLDIGGVQPSIKVPHLLGLTIKLPEKELLNKYDETVKNYFDKITTNYNQIQILTALRDTLLPKLMSGELRVKE